MRLSITTIVYAVALVAIAGCMTAKRVQRAAKPVRSLLPPLPPGAVAVSITRFGQNQVVVSWNNDAASVDQLQSRRGLTGDWNSVAGAHISPVTVSATNRFEFFRVVRNAPPAPTNVVQYFNGQTPTVWGVSWENGCTNCDSITISRSQTAKDWVQIGQVAATATNFNDNAAPWPGTNYFRVRSVKNGVSSIN